MGLVAVAYNLRLAGPAPRKADVVAVDRPAAKS